MQWPKDGDGCRWDSQPGHPSAAYVRPQGIGHVRVHRHRPVTDRVKTIGVKREGRRRYVVLSGEDVPAQPLPSTGAVDSTPAEASSGLIDRSGPRLISPSDI
ncbi:hypothetical protein AB0B56_10575 [Streptosporangium canum]|uniref:hypothetical protein n=1 Tax=Streptosporangium canum TaxID=324952 RepID=UPI00342A1EBE